jgi:hypothetical protein
MKMRGVSKKLSREIETAERERCAALCEAMADRALCGPFNRKGRSIAFAHQRATAYRAAAERMRKQ